MASSSKAASMMLHFHSLRRKPYPRLALFSTVVRQNPHPSAFSAQLRAPLRPLPCNAAIQCFAGYTRSIHKSALIHSRVTIAVPTMGDSITEGTIVEWCVQPGTHVQEGDVLALVETDKVTVDIKAEREGVLVEQLGEVEGVVEVGQGLYVLDTDVSNATIQSSEKYTDSESKPDEVETIEVKAEDTASSERVPSIHFLGKDGWKARLAETESSPPSPAPSAASTNVTTVHAPSGKPSSPTSTTEIPYNAMYGRPPITEEEMDALILGGADEAPEVKKIVSKDGLSGFMFVGGKIVTAGPRGVWLAKEKM